jgi:hypothetical protein
MKKYEICGRSMQCRTFWKKYVTKLDENITYRMWQYYTKKIQKSIMAKSNSILAAFEDELVTEASLEQTSLKKILFIGDKTLQEILENPEQLLKIPPRERMKWVFNAMKARDSRMTVMIKKKGEERKQTVTEELLKAAQYGSVEVEDLEDGEEPMVALPEPIIEKPAEIQFSPDKEFANAESGEKL